MRTSTFTLTVAALIAAATAIGWAISLWIPGKETSSEVTEGQGPVIKSDFELVDQDGRLVRGEDLRGKLQLVFFGFTTCPDICPTTLTKITATLEELGADADTLHPVLMTVDPERDTPAVLKEYLGAFDPRIIGLTGTPEQVKVALRNFRVFASKNWLEGGDYTMDHSTFAFLVDRNGRYVEHFGRGVDEEQVAQRALVGLK